MVVKDDRYHVYGTFRGMRVRKTTGIPARREYKQHAEAERLAIERAVLDGTYTQALTTARSFESVAKEYELWRRREGRLVDSSLLMLAAHKRYWGKTPIGEITNGRVRQWLNDECAGLASSSARRKLNQLKAVLGWAVEAGYLESRPRLPSIRDGDPRQTHLTEAEVLRLLEWLADNAKHFLPHFATLIFTGVRLNELLRIKARDVVGAGHESGSNGHILVRKMDRLRRKTVSRTIPMSDVLSSVLADVVPLPDGTLFYAESGKPWHSPNSASAWLGKILDRALDGIGVKEDVRVHDLRHTFAYLMAQNGADLGDLQWLLGHKDVSQTMVYRGFVKSRADDVVRTVAEKVGRKAGKRLANVLTPKTNLTSVAPRDGSRLAAKVARRLLSD